MRQPTAPRTARLIEVPRRSATAARYPAAVSIVGLIDPERVARISRDVYVRMIDEGMLPEQARIQLLEGVLVEMSPQGDLHALTGEQIATALRACVGARAHVAVEKPFNATSYSRPEPDVALWPPVSGRRTTLPDHLLLAVEVAVSSLRDDRALKAPIYAAAAVPEYWIVNLVDDVVERYTLPGPDGYASAETLRRGERITLAALPDVSVTVDDLLPAP